jgi:hypothetical protein
MWSSVEINWRREDKTLECGDFKTPGDVAVIGRVYFAVDCYYDVQKNSPTKKPSNNLVIPANIRHTLLQTCVSVLLKEKICVATCVKKPGSGHLHNCCTDKVQGHKRHFLDPTREWYRWLFWFYMRISVCTIQLISLGQSKQKHEIGGIWEETRNPNKSFNANPYKKIIQLRWKDDIKI